MPAPPKGGEDMVTLLSEALWAASLPRSAPPGYIPASRKMGPDSTASPCPALPRDGLLH